MGQPKRKTATAARPKVDPRLRKLAEQKAGTSALAKRLNALEFEQRRQQRANQKAIGGDAPSSHVARAGQGISPAQQQILAADPADAEIAILPTGELYMPHVHVRRRLNKAFGAGCYVIRECSPVARQGDQVVQTWAIDIDGIGERARATGGAEYRQNNSRMTWDDAIESAKSIAISRCGKAMSIGLMLWDRQFQRSWRRSHCVIAFVRQPRRQGMKESYQWRRRDDEPLDGEAGFVDPQVDPDKAADWARRVRRKQNDDVIDHEPVQPPTSRSGRPAPGSVPSEDAKSAGSGTTAKAPASAQLATTTGFAPPVKPDTPQVFTFVDDQPKDGTIDDGPNRGRAFKMWRTETVYAIADGRTGRAQYAVFDRAFVESIANLIQRQQPCELDWKESKRTPGTFRLTDIHPLTNG